MVQASDGYHQVGTTRMGRDAKSVVDSDLKVHDVENLYVASSSVFPTTGQANSTYLAVALAVRLANYLSLKVVGARKSEVAVAGPATQAESDRHASR
jgi:choline dehydrogenase-like flavoprotein